MSYLKFRFWCPAGKAFIRDYHYEGPVEELFAGHREFDLLIPQQCLGIKDRRAHWVFEGDIIELTASQLPPSLALLGAKEKLPEKLTAEVSRDPCLPSNFHLEVCRGEPGKLTIYLPLELAKIGSVIGHIFSVKEP